VLRKLSILLISLAFLSTASVFAQTGEGVSPEKPKCACMAKKGKSCGMKECACGKECKCQKSCGCPCCNSMEETKPSGVIPQ
jgi:hypothetical protein